MSAWQLARHSYCTHGLGNQKLRERKWERSVASLPLQFGGVYHQVDGRDRVVRAIHQSAVNILGRVCVWCGVCETTVILWLAAVSLLWPAAVLSTVAPS